MSISCPKCSVPTSDFNLEADLFFDRCEVCSGMWLDHGELARTTGSKDDFPEPERAHPGRISALKCPKCTPPVYLHKVMFDSNSQIEVDVCGSCQGLWLDSRELQGAQEALRRHRILEKKRRLSGR